MIDVKGLQKNYGGLQVLKGVDLTINKGDCRCAGSAPRAAENPRSCAA